MFQKASSIYRNDPAGFWYGLLRVLVLVAGIVAIWNATMAIALCGELHDMGHSCLP